MMQQPVRLALLGDSLIFGHGLERSQALPAQLEAALRRRGRDVVVLDHGVSGSTTSDGLARLSSVLQDRPDIVLVALGSNDSFDYWNNNIEQVERNLGEIVDRLKAAGVVVWMAGTRVSRRLGWRNLVKVAINSLLELGGRRPAFHAQSMQYAMRFNAVHRRVAGARRVPLYPHLVAGVKRHQQVDLLHPDAAGVSVIIGRLLPFVLRHLDEYRGSRPGQP